VGDSGKPEIFPVDIKDTVVNLIASIYDS